MTGRTEWPTTEATFERRVILTMTGMGGRGGRTTSRRDLFSYEIDGIMYTATVQEYPRVRTEVLEPGTKVTLYYKPGNPKRIYYPPACRLVDRFVVSVVVLVGGIAISIEIALNH